MPMHTNACLIYTECGAIRFPDRSLTRTLASLRVPQSAAPAGAGPLWAPAPHPEQLESAGRYTLARRWAGRGRQPGRGPASRAQQGGPSRPVSPGTRPDRRSDAGHQAASRASARGKCAGLPEEYRIGALASALPTAASRTRGQEPPRSHLTPLNSTGAGETGAPRGAPRLGPRIAGSPGGGGARVSTLLPGPRAARLASATALIGPTPGQRLARALPGAASCPPAAAAFPRRPAPELPAGWVPAARAAPAGPPNEAEMTSKEEGKAAPGEERRRSPLDHLPPPANSNKPLTPFSIEDILNKPSVRRSYSLCGAAHLLAAADKHSPGGLPLAGRALLSQTSPLCALEELASKTFKGLEVSVLQAAEGRDGMTIFGQRQTPKKRRKSRTAFTNHQIYELEKRFLYQKYLSPADRDQIAQQLGLTNAQVITWFQNRRAKLKRDLEEMKADVESAKKLGPSGQMDIVALAELEQNSEAAGGGGGGGGGCGRAKSRPGSPALPPGVPQAPGAGPLQLSPASPLTDQPASSQDCSEDEEDEEIDVDD